MISFIVIGRNEGWRLTKCLGSVFNTIKENKLIEYEVLYIDSDSTDDSIERAQLFPGIRIFQITGDCNAAIGRNVGAKEAKGDVLFFIDGDMEVNSSFLPLVYNEEESLKYNYVSGQFIDHHYNDKWAFINKCEYFANFKKDNIKSFSFGGLFFIKREIWELAGGMKTYLNVNEDIEFGLRLARKGIFLLRKKDVLAIHHTISYSNTRRMWRKFLDGNEFYKVALLRNSLLNKYQWKLFIRENYTSIVCLIAILSYLLLDIELFLLIYFITLAARVLQKKVTLLQKLNLLFYFLIRDIATWPALLLFFPSNKKQFSYKRL